MYEVSFLQSSVNNHHFQYMRAGLWLIKMFRGTSCALKSFVFYLASHYLKRLQCFVSLSFILGCSDVWSYVCDP